MKVLSENLASAFAFLAPPVEAARGARVRNESSETTVDSSTQPAPTSTNKAIKDTLQISAAAEAQLAAEDELTAKALSSDDNSSKAQGSNAPGTKAQVSKADKADATDAPSDTSSNTKTDEAAKSDGGPGVVELSEEEQEVVEKLESRDREVRTHEQAHVAAGGPYVTGGPTYSYQQGPDGQQYAVGGQVSIDTSAEDTPEETLIKARVVRAAALAPAEPSAQDRAVAAAATKLESQAAQELRQQKVASTDDSEGDDAEQDDFAEIVESGLLLDLIG